MNLRLDDEDSVLLRALADAEQVSLHEAALRAIRRSAQEIAPAERVREATAEMTDRWKEVLYRLGRACLIGLRPRNTSACRTSWTW
jgi:uncharacterized protein (DUF1778 family)